MLACIIASFGQKATVTLLLRVPPVPEGDKEWYLYAARAGLIIGVPNHRRDFSLTTIARAETGINRLAPPHHFHS
jgi:hypothetical protein